LYDLVAILRQAGHAAYVAHTSPNARYRNTPHTFDSFYTRDILKARDRLSGRGQTARTYRRAQWFIEDIRGGLNRKLDLTNEDTLVVPDFRLAEAAAAFPDTRKILFIQNSFSLLRSYEAAANLGVDPARGVIAAIGISDTCIDALSLLGYDPIYRCPVAPNLSLFPVTKEKKAQICYMPRKRPRDARIVTSALRRRGRLDRYKLIEIDGMPQAEVARILCESLVFISFMKNEALGFPAMEAMSAGCVVVGFTGLGTEEYFTPETGLPVPEGDLTRLVLTVEDTLHAYDRDPGPFDDMRAYASQVVAERYGGRRFEDGVHGIWEKLKRS